MGKRLRLIVGGLAILVAVAGCATTAQPPAGQRSQATVTPAPTSSPVPTTTPQPGATATPPPAARCPTTTGDLSKIRPGGMGASPDTFASVWGPEDGSPGPGGTYSFGRYPDSGIDKIFAQDGAVARIYGMDYHADTSQTLTLPQATQIVNSQILPADAGQLTFPPAGGTLITVQYCSPAFAAAFPASTGVTPTGFIWVTYYFRSNGDVDRMHVSGTSYLP